MDDDKTDDEMMLFYRRPMKVKDVEAIAKRNMGDHDNLPRKLRDAANKDGGDTRVPKWVSVRSKSIADKYIRDDGSKPAAKTDEEIIVDLEVEERAAWAKVQAAHEEHKEIDRRYKRMVAKVRYPLLNAFARQCLGHAECCDLRATQVEWLRKLEHETVEVRDRDLEWRGRAYDVGRAFSKDEMDRVIRIWLKIKAYHEIEDATTGIEFEIEQEVARREEREARDREWRARMAPLPGGWRTPHLVEFEPAVAAAVMARIKEPIIRRR
jgi:hypothetical protein